MSGDATSTVIDIVSRQAFARLGWDYDTEVNVDNPSDDVRLIKAAAPAFVDVTLEEVLKVFNAQAEKVMGTEDHEAQYTYAQQHRAESSRGGWIVLPGIYTDRDAAVRAVSVWRGDGRFDAVISPSSGIPRWYKVYVRLTSEAA